MFISFRSTHTKQMIDKTIAVTFATSRAEFLTFSEVSSAATVVDARCCEVKSFLVVVDKKGAPVVHP